MVNITYHTIKHELQKYERLENKALVLAKITHQDQKRKDGEEYINHPIRVADDIVETYGYLAGKKAELHLYCMGILHDVIEDSPIPEMRQIVEEEFPKNVYEVVKIMTKGKDENYLDYILRIRKNYIAVLVKLADLKDNLSNLQKGTLRDKYLLAQHILAK